MGFHPRTDTSGGREGGREQRQPATTKKSKSAKQNTQQSSETTEAGQQREGTNALLKKGREGTGWVGGKWGKSERARKGQKKKVCALHPLDSPGGVEGAPTYTPVSKVAPKRGGRRGMRGQDHTLGP